MHTSTRVHSHEHAPSCVQTHTHMHHRCAHAREHMHAHLYMRTHMDTHAPTRSLTHSEAAEGPLTSGKQPEKLCFPQKVGSRPLFFHYLRVGCTSYVIKTLRTSQS